MGYWAQSEDGHSLMPVTEEYPLVWGDAPADIMDAALDGIFEAFYRDKGRTPTEAEVKAGLLFSLRPRLERAHK